MVGRKSKRTARQDSRKSPTERRQDKPAKRKRKMDTSTSTISSSREPPRRIKAPKMAAVTITTAPGSKTTANEALAAARRHVNLAEMGLDEVRIRPTISGGVLIEVPGEENVSKAEALANKLKEMFPEGGDVRISRPSKRIDVKILGLEASIQPREVAIAIAEVGDCEAGEVKVGMLKKRTQRGALAAWAQCPAQAAKKIVERGKLKIGWITARVEPLRSRPLVCFKCMGGGHAAKDCQSEKGSAEICFNCGGPGHKARNCTARPKCLACEKAGRNAEGLHLTPLPEWPEASAGERGHLQQGAHGRILEERDDQERES